MHSTFRGAPSARSHPALALRCFLAAGVALLALPTLSLSPAYAAEGEPDDTTVTSTDGPAPEQPAITQPEPAGEETSPSGSGGSDSTTATSDPTETAGAGSGGAPADKGGKGSDSGKDTGSTTEASTLAVPTAQVTTAAPSCKVTTFLQNTQEDGLGDWVAGNLNAVKADFAEGDFVPQKVELAGLVPGTFTLNFSFDRTKGNLYAYDYVDHLRIENSTGATATWASVKLQDQDDFNGPAPVDEPQTGTYTVFVAVTFTITDAADATATLRWDGHIAAELDYGPATAAGTINGSPYHFDLISTDGPYGCDAGARANQLAADAVDAARITIIKNAAPNSAEDFDFTIQAPNGLSATPTLDDDAGATGEDTEFSNAITYTVPPGTSTVTETPTPGWDLTDLSCVKAGLPTGTRSGNGVSLALADNDLVTCVFTNSRTSSLTVDKMWVINGGSAVADGSEPEHLGLDARLLLDDTVSVWGQTYSGYLEDISVDIDEDVTFGNKLCRWEDPAKPFGTINELADAPLAETVNLSGGANHYTVTNRVTCDSELTLLKKVQNGPAAESAWQLSATPTGDGIDFATGATGVNGPVTASTPYILDEDDADTRYNQYGEWSCTGVGAGVTTVDAHQRVTVAPGRSATCTVTNATGVLVLEKQVPNEAGGTATPDEFTLVADPATAGAENLTTPGSTTGTTFYVDPDETFSLSEEEDGPEGYTLSSLTCSNGDSPDAVQVDANTTVTCTYVNTELPSSLTLQKVVDDNNTGDTTGADAWTLTGTPVGIDGQDAITGDGFATGSTTAGVYQLDETGPATHTEGDWACEVDGEEIPVSSDDQITIGLDQHVVCEIENTAIQPTLTLVKEVDPGTTQDDTGANEFILTATPGNEVVDQAAFGGEGGATSVVKVGSYTLSEQGPITHRPDARGWRCLDGNGATVPVSDANAIEVGLAMAVTCTIENEAVPSEWTVTKTADRANGTTVLPGQAINYTVTLTKVGTGVDIHGIVVEDTLTGVEDSWVSGLPAEAMIQDGVITWNAPVLGAEGLTLTYTVTVGPDAWDSTIENHVTPGPVPCVNVGDVDCDDTVHHTPHYTLDKSVEHLATPGDGDDLVEPGERLEYTLTVRNDTEHAIVDAVITDDASDVFDNAVMISSESELDALGIEFDGTPGAETLTWTIEDLAPGAVAKATYVVQVAPGSWGETLHNVATPEPATGGECAPAGEVPAEDGKTDDIAQCETTSTVPQVTTMLVEKRDAETDEVLAGATFELFLDADNAVAEDGGCTYPATPTVGEGDASLGSATTLAAGQVQFADLQTGCYLLVETKAPTGYDLPPNPVMGVEIDEDNFVGGGVMAAIVVTDFAQGQIPAITKQQFELVGEEWVPSDGTVEYGDRVRYVMSFEATGPKNFHDVRVTDHVPGFDLLDLTSTLDAVVIPGSVQCTGELSCTTSVGLLDQLVTWDFGDLEPAVGETLRGTAVMEVFFPKLPDLLAPLAGQTRSDALRNVAHLEWDELQSPTAGRTAARAPLATNKLTTNEVIVRASVTVPPPAGVVETPGTGKPGKTGELPQTGAPAGLVQLGFLAMGLLAAGVALARRNRKA